MQTRAWAHRTLGGGSQPSRDPAGAPPPPEPGRDVGGEGVRGLGCPQAWGTESGAVGRPGAAAHLCRHALSPECCPPQRPAPCVPDRPPSPGGRRAWSVTGGEPELQRDSWEGAHPAFSRHCPELSLPEGSELLAGVRQRPAPRSVCSRPPAVIPRRGPTPEKERAHLEGKGTPRGAAHAQPAAPTSPQTPALLQGALCWLAVASSSPSGLVSLRQKLIFSPLQVSQGPPFSVRHLLFSRLPVSEPSTTG